MTIDHFPSGVSPEAIAGIGRDYVALLTALTQRENLTAPAVCERLKYASAEMRRLLAYTDLSQDEVDQVTSFFEACVDREIQVAVYLLTHSEGSA